MINKVCVLACACPTILFFFHELIYMYIHFLDVAFVAGV